MGKHFNSVVKLNSFARQVRNTLAELLIVAMVVAFAASAFAQVPVHQCGQVLSKPGNYVLTAALNNEICNSGSIVISASNIHLNTAGQSFSPVGAPALVIDNGLSNILIDGGGFLGLATGVVIGASRNITLNNLLIPAYHSDNCACCQNDRIRGWRRRMRRSAWRA